MARSTPSSVQHSVGRGTGYSHSARKELAAVQTRGSSRAGQLQCGLRRRGAGSSRLAGRLRQAVCQGSRAVDFFLLHKHYHRAQNSPQRLLRLEPKSSRHTGTHRLWREAVEAGAISHRDLTQGRSAQSQPRIAEATLVEVPGGHIGGCSQAQTLARARPSTATITRACQLLRRAAARIRQCCFLLGALGPS